MSYHQKAISSVISELETDLLNGLAQEEARRRAERHGPNQLQEAKRISPWQILADQFKNVLIVILLIATGLSLALGHGVESVAIAVIVLFAVGLGFVQEYRSERALEALKGMAAPTAAVVRDGREVQIPARELVPGDIILLRPGDRVPADSRVVEAVNLQIDEAALTGESVAVEKLHEALPGGDLPVNDRRNMAYAGTVVTYGRGRAAVTATGMETEFGKIARMLQSVETEKTPLQVDLDKVGKRLAQAALVVVLVIAAAGILRGQPLMQMVLFSIALAVAVVPEALPAVVTISLAMGVQRMVKRNALVRRLPAVETLGSTTVICSDKTGTLTKDEMTGVLLRAGGREYQVTGAGYRPQGEFLTDGKTAELTEAAVLLLKGGALCSDAHLSEAGGSWGVKGDPTEGALISLAGKAGLEKVALDREYERIHEVPFTSETKRMVTVHRHRSGTIAFAKGAPEAVLDLCVSVAGEKGAEGLDERRRETLLASSREMAGKALRVLAVAARENPGAKDPAGGMTFLGLVGLMDPPRPEAKAAIQKCLEAGIKPVMITGDHPVTARAIASDLGILRGGRVLTGQEIEEIPDDVLQQEAMGIDVYARVSPAHKLKVVTAFQRQGQVVAMTGDGVNDAPALKKADIGIAMGISGTDVTKEASAMILTDDNFASIVAAVEEGRGIYGNIKKYLMYLLSSNIGEILLMAVATFLGWPLPLSAVQILYVNLATDGLPALALAVDPPEDDLMKRPPRPPRQGIFTRPVSALMAVGGVWSALVNLCVFSWARGSGHSLEQAMAITFISLVLIQFFKAYNFRSDRHSAMHRPLANKWLNLAIVWELLLLALVIYLPILQKPFGTFAIPPRDLLVIFAASLSVFPALELAKAMVRRGWLGKVE